MAFLSLISKDGSKKKLFLRDGEITLGRENSNDFQIRDKKVSRVHCKISNHSKGFILRDNGSRNGVFINGKKVSERILKQGDSILIGDTKLSYFEGEDEGTQADFSAPPLPKSALNQTKMLSLNDIYKKHTLNLTQELPIEGDDGIFQKGFYLLYKVSKSLYATKSLFGFMNQVLEMVFEAVQPDRGAIMSIDKATGKFRADHKRFSENCLRSGNRDAKYSQTLMDTVMNDRVALLTTNASMDPRFKMSQSIITNAIHSAMLIPLWQEDKIVGIIYLDNFSISDYFTEEYLELLTGVAYQITNAIMQARLNVKLREAAHTKDLLIEAIMQLKRSEKRDLVKVAAREIKNFLECKVVGYCEWPKKKKMHLHLSSSEKEPAIPFTGDINTLEDAEVIRLGSLDYDKAWSDLILTVSDELKELGISILLPVRSENEMLGIFFAGDDPEIAKFDDEIEFINVMAKFLKEFSN